MFTKALPLALLISLPAVAMEQKQVTTNTDKQATINALLSTQLITEQLANNTTNDLTQLKDKIASLKTARAAVQKDIDWYKSVESDFLRDVKNLSVKEAQAKEELFKKIDENAEKLKKDKSVELAQKTENDKKYINGEIEKTRTEEKATRETKAKYEKEISELEAILAAQTPGWFSSLLRWKKNS